MLYISEFSSNVSAWLTNVRNVLHIDNTYGNLFWYILGHGPINDKSRKNNSACIYSLKTSNDITKIL